MNPPYPWARRLREAVDRIVKHYLGGLSTGEFPVIESLRSGLHPFGVLVAIILSQNTSDRNSGIALSRLRRALGMELRPESFRHVTINELAEIIKPSGMQVQKATTIINLLKEFEGEFNALLNDDPESLRSRLLSVKGVGPKTADVFLLFIRRYPTFPIDTHIRRFLVRFGVGGRGESYESLRRKVLSALPRSPDYLLAAHLSIIKHGRRVCKSRKPLCGECVVRKLCFYGGKGFN